MSGCTRQWDLITALLVWPKTIGSPGPISMQCTFQGATALGGPGQGSPAQHYKRGFCVELDRNDQRKHGKLGMPGHRSWAE